MAIDKRINKSNWRLCDSIKPSGGTKQAVALNEANNR